MDKLAFKIATQIADTVGGGNVTPGPQADTAQFTLTGRSSGAKLLRTLKSKGFTQRGADNFSWFKPAPDRSYCVLVSIDPQAGDGSVTVRLPIDDDKVGRPVYPKPSRTGTLLHALINRMMYAVRGSGAFWLEADHYARLFAESSNRQVSVFSARFLRSPFSDKLASDVYDGGALPPKSLNYLSGEDPRDRERLDEALEYMATEIDQSAFGNG